MFLIKNRLITWIPLNRAPKLDESAIYDKLYEQFPQYRHEVRVQNEVPVAVTVAIQRGATFAAHNAEGFDAIAWEQFGEGHPSWYDTMHCCRAGGLPAGLGKVSIELGGQGKDEAGKKVMMMLTKAKNGRYPVGTLAVWDMLIHYNVIDVLELKRVYDETRYYHEPLLLAKHCEINQRGIPVDLALAARLKNLWAQHQEESKERVDELTEGGLSGNDVYSTQKVKAWLAKMGLILKSLERKQVEEMMHDPDSYFGDTDDPIVCRVTEVIKARSSAVRATVGKIDRVFRVTDPDQRVRGSIVYYGAHTGRFSGRDLQPHNFPRGVSNLDVEWLLEEHALGDLTLRDVETAAREAKCSVGDALGTLMRPVITAGAGKVFPICDYAAVEARMVSWLARDENALNTFFDPKRSMYCEMGSALFGRTITKKGDPDEYQLAKKIVLGCGYGMGANKFGATCSLEGIDLKKVGVTPEECVKAYRKQFAPVVHAWREYERCAFSAVNGRDAFTNRVEFLSHGDHLHVVLPSGRVLHYRHVRIVSKPPKWAPDGEPRPALVYRSGHGYDKDLYGGLIMENISQASSRDLMGDALFQLDDVVVHVHDEIVQEVCESKANAALCNLARVMSTPPIWAKSFPLRVEGFTSKRYLKSAPRGAFKIDMMCGKEIA